MVDVALVLTDKHDVGVNSELVIDIATRQVSCYQTVGLEVIDHTYFYRITGSFNQFDSMRIVKRIIFCAFIVEVIVMEERVQLHVRRWYHLYGCFINPVFVIYKLDAVIRRFMVVAGLSAVTCIPKRVTILVLEVIAGHAAKNKELGSIRLSRREVCTVNGIVRPIPHESDVCFVRLEISGYMTIAIGAPYMSGIADWRTIAYLTAQKTNGDVRLFEDTAGEDPENGNTTPVFYSKYMLDIDDRIIRIDEYFEGMTGYSEEDAVGKMTQKDLIPPEDWAQYNAQVRDAFMRTGDIAYLRHRILRKDGTIIEVICHGERYFDSSVREFRSTVLVFEV